jgi:hypothetical protein
MLAVRLQLWWHPPNAPSHLAASRHRSSAPSPSDHLYIWEKLVGVPPVATVASNPETLTWLGAPSPPPSLIRCPMRRRRPRCRLTRSPHPWPPPPPSALLYGLKPPALGLRHRSRTRTQSRASWGRRWRSWTGLWGNELYSPRVAWPDTV